MTYLIATKIYKKIKRWVRKSLNYQKWVKLNKTLELKNRSKIQEETRILELMDSKTKPAPPTPLTSKPATLEHPQVMFKVQKPSPTPHSESCKTVSILKTLRPAPPLSLAPASSQKTIGPTPLLTPCATPRIAPSVRRQKSKFLKK